MSVHEAREAQDRVVISVLRKGPMAYGRFIGSLQNAARREPELLTLNSSDRGRANIVRQHSLRQEPPLIHHIRNAPGSRGRRAKYFILNPDHPAVVTEIEEAQRQVWRDKIATSELVNDVTEDEDWDEVTAAGVQNDPTPPPAIEFGQLSDEQLEAFLERAQRELRHRSLERQLPELEARVKTARAKQLELEQAYIEAQLKLEQATAEKVEAEQQLARVEEEYARL